MRDDLPKPTSLGYDRPNQPRVCGRMAEGEPCELGPGKRGDCPEKPKCQPARSLRTSRGVVVRSAMVFATGLVLMLLGGSARNQWIAPGPLCSQHAQVLEGKSWEQRCATCHAAGEQSVGSWLTAVVGTKLGPVQSTKCLGCHDKTINPQRALDPHNVPADFLASLSGGEAHGDTKQLACSVCHQEHHGTDHDLAAMTDQRCQSCHTQKYESFAKDHPEFTRWPYERRTRIAFNHATHMNKHFNESKQAFACQQCHVEDASGAVQLTLAYEKTCASCHDQDIVTSTAAGVKAIALPMLDIDWLADAGHSVKDWPERATGDFDGKLPAVMKLLLAQDDEARAAMQLLGTNFDFFDIDFDDAKQMKATATLAMSIQQLLDRLEQAEETDVSALVGLTADLVAQARQAWRGEDANRAANEARPGTWWSDDVALALRYQPNGHADPLIKRWLEAIVSIEDDSLREDLLTEFTGKGAVGRCTECHSIDRGREGNRPLRIHWKAHDRRSDARGFTLFTHGPHLLPLELRDCTACHAINPDATTAGNYSGTNAQSFTSEFVPMTKTQCASCHQQGGVSDRCTDCHNYHVEW